VQSLKLGVSNFTVLRLFLVRNTGQGLNNLSPVRVVSEIAQTAMLRYTAHRILLMIPTLLGVAVLVFVRSRWADVKSPDINAYIKEYTGADFSSKDFRTWNATVLAAVALAVSGPAAQASKTARKRAITRAVEEVAYYLGNTPAVCRASYIDPRIFDRFEDGLTIGGALVALQGDPSGPTPRGGDTGDIESLHGSAEEAVLDLIAAEEESPVLERVA
jgi:hypothetical protein